ncbi:MAG: 2-C-methyl-D-erythritol 2,4-cyclodiphosphate synthase [Ideonella sp.]
MSDHAPGPTAMAKLPKIRIGEGWDIHALVTGRPLILGGVNIPHSHGLMGHSDADALCHAITDALFGAAALGDIGRHFPDTDPRFKGADSLALLAEAARRVRAAGWEIGNIDSTIVAQAPKLAPHLPKICQALALALAVDVSQVNVKAKTAERMGPVGRGEAMEARAVCLLIGSAAPAA